jgi:TPR repeat protein
MYSYTNKLFAILSVIFFLSGCNNSNDLGFCDSGDGCVKLGLKYGEKATFLNGDEKSKIEKIALRYYEKGCDFNNAKSCAMYGLSLQRSGGENIDEKTIYNYYNKACSLGSKIGCNQLEFSK